MDCQLIRQQFLDIGVVLVASVLCLPFLFLLPPLLLRSFGSTRPVRILLQFSQQFAPSSLSCPRHRLEHAGTNAPAAQCLFRGIGELDP